MKKVKEELRKEKKKRKQRDGDARDKEIVSHWAQTLTRRKIVSPDLIIINHHVDVTRRETLAQYGSTHADVSAPSSREPLAVAAAGC